MIIEIENLKKYFKEVKAVDGLSFRVKEGELFSFLGVNGAGKSTTLNIVCGVLDKDEGTVKICGRDIDTHMAEVKEDVGIVFQSSVLDKKLTVYDNLKYRASCYGIFGKGFSSRLEEMDELLKVGEILKRPVGKLSGGQRRRADIARALFPRPKLLILDEPTTGLDPGTRVTVWNAVQKLRETEGLTVLLTTHYMEEAANSDYVVIIDGGKKVAEGTPHELKSKYASDYLRIFTRIDEAESYFADKNLPSKRTRDFLEIEFKDTGKVRDFMLEKPAIFEDFEVLKGNMDDVFLKVTGKNLKEA